MGSGAGELGRAERLPMFFLFLLLLFCPALCEQIRYRIPEEMPKGSVVGNLATDLGFSVQELPTRKLRVSSEKPYFTVSTERGELLVSSRLDREEICGKIPACALEFEAVAENPLNFYHVNVEIEDINDHTPTFTQNSFELQISESAQPGTRFILEVAEDADTGLNSLQKYKLSLNPSFSLIIKEKQDGSKYPELALEKTLDREQQSYHRLVLTALDGGDPPLSGTTELRIQVTDANDNPPVFSRDVYRVSLRENVPPGTTVLQVSATDQDEGINSEITYSFYRTGQIFGLNSKSGEITTQKKLDFEETKEYSMIVEGRDGGGLVAQCTIEINIQDENDNSPEVTFHSLLEMILENAVPGTLIALIKIHDQDSGENGEVNCQLQGEVPFKIISSSKNSYKLVTDGTLDREQTPEYNVTITATDRGKPPLSSSISVILHISDVNDNAPVFHQASYLVSVAENNPPGASIAQVCASDPDLGLNGQVSYFIMASDLEPLALASYVSVSAQSGVVFAQRAFDYEQLRAFELTLQARDQGSPALSANVSLRVLVGDRNDNEPRVLYPALGPDGSALFDMVPRAAEPGYLVTKVVAVDADSGHNAWLSYHVLQASEPGLFSLGLRTGEVRTARALGDRDAARQRLLVAVRDGGQPSLSATVTLHLVFADSLQDVLPDITDRPVPSDPQAELQFYLVVALALISVLFLLAMILAIALRLRRSSSPAAWSCFQPGLCVKSGPVIPPNYSEGTLPYSYNLCVAHTGKTEFNFLKCSEQLSSGQEILCGDSSGALFPLCNSSESTSHPELILENSPPGMVVALFKTRDLDFGGNGEVRCNIETDIPFKIYSSSNNYYKLVTDGALDREQTPEYNVTIVATDRGKPPLSSSRSITLYVTDINDNAPVFDRTSYVVHVAENNPPGASIAQVSASDPDLGLNGHISYSIVASDLEPLALSSYVSVSAQSGVVFAQRAFDHEQLRAFELTLQAGDHGSPALSANVSLRVLVGDRNDNAPRVLYPALGPDGSALFDMVPRSAEPGYLVTKVVAVDADSGHNAWLSYHVLQASEPGLFSLGLRTGEVRMARALGDRDAARQRLLVTVRDGGQPPLSATATLHLVFADNLQEILPDLREYDRPVLSDPQAELQFYLVVALALISVLFLLAVILAIALRLRRSLSPTAWDCFRPGLCVKSGPVVPPNYSEGTLPYSYNLCIAHTGTKEFNFLKCSAPIHSNEDVVCSVSPGALIPPYGGKDLTSHSETLTSQAPPNTDWRFSQAQRPGTSGSQNGDDTGTWPNNQFDTEMLQAMILASASEAADGSSTLGGGAGTMGLSARYGPQFTLQHVPDYRQNVYIPGSNATLTNAAGKRDGKAPAGGNGNKKKSGKKEKK
ncbi:protocadherin gamma-B5 isoform X1 [Rhinopithecus roxellana]|uniref:protocadherin gamma-B5 isoform X1 n=1 Tax=Rhinopithecus roxellana TaxID=61622 RepID=UPI0012374288|nr:protocadherin gamma-B5 isoform X1 [Rhinopithecus roxellana]